MSTVIDGSAGITTNAGGSVNPSTTIDGINYSCRAWVNFNGTTVTPSTIRGSGNVTSVTKNATGDYTVNFTTAMTDANYSVSGVAQFGTSGGSQSFVAVKSAATPYLTTSINIVGIRSETAALTDFVAINIAVFR